MILFHLFHLSSKDIFNRWHSNVNKTVSTPVTMSLCTTVRSGRLCFSCLSVKIVISQVILTSLYSATGKVDGHTTCWYTVIHTSCIAPNVPVEPPFCGPPHIPSGQVSTDNMSYYCIGGFTAQSVQQCLRCLIYAVLDRVCSQCILSLIVILKACYFYQKCPYV